MTRADGHCTCGAPATRYVVEDPAIVVCEMAARELPRAATRLLPAASGGADSTLPGTSLTARDTTGDRLPVTAGVAAKY